MVVNLEKDSPFSAASSKSLHVPIHCSSMDRLEHPFERPGLSSLYTLARHFAGADVGHRQASAAFNRVAQEIALHLGEFQWGEHRFEQQTGESQCQYCGAEFSDMLDDLGCSAIE